MHQGLERDWLVAQERNSVRPGAGSGGYGVLFSSFCGCRLTLKALSQSLVPSLCIFLLYFLRAEMPRSCIHSMEPSVKK